MAKATILLVQHAHTNGNNTKRFLERAGYDVVWTGSGLAALMTAKQMAVDLILLDAALTDMDASVLFWRFRSHTETKQVPIILLTASGFTGKAFHGSEGKPDAYIAKPYGASELDAGIMAVLRARSAAGDDAQKDRQSGDALSTTEGISNAVPSTMLINRQQFEVMFSKEFKRALRFKQHMSCMLIDMDGLSLGRMSDKATLATIVGLVEHTIREVDTAVWWTGTALMVLLPNTIHHDALQAAARILVAVANHPFSRHDSSVVTMSIGVAGLPDHTIDSDQKLIIAAIVACKRAGALMLKLVQHDMKEVLVVNKR